MLMYSLKRRSRVKKPLVIPNEPSPTVVVTRKIRAFGAPFPRVGKPMWLYALLGEMSRER